MASTRPDDAVLVPVDPDDPGVFLVIAESWNSVAFPLEPMPILPTEVEGLLAPDVLAYSAGGANTAIQALNGLQSAQGLVRLAPETLAALRAGATPLTSGGWNLGVLTQTGSSKFATQVRWLPSTGASVLSVAAAIGPALTMVAIQWQLAQIARQVQICIDLTNEVLRQARTEKWATVQAGVTRLAGLGQTAGRLGTVSNGIMDEARGWYRDLSPLRQQLLEEVGHHTQELSRKRSAKARRDFLANNAEVLLRDTQALIAASDGCVIYEVLRAVHLRQTEPEHARIVAEQALEERAADRIQIADATTRLVRGLELVAQSPGSVTFPVGKRAATPREAADAAGALAAALRSMNYNIEEPLAPDPVPFFDGKARPEVARVCMWHLEPGEELKAAAEFPRSVLLSTTRRLIACSRKDLTTLWWYLDPHEVKFVSVYEDFGDWNAVFHTSEGKQQDKFFEIESDDGKNKAHAVTTANKILTWAQQNARTGVVARRTQESIQAP